MKPSCSYEIILRMIGCSLKYISFEKILYIVLHKEIGLYSANEEELLILGMITILVTSLVESSK